MASKLKPVNKVSGHVQNISLPMTPTKEMQSSSTEEAESDLHLGDACSESTMPTNETLAQEKSETTIPTQQDHVYRVSGLPLELQKEQMSDLISALFNLNEDQSAFNIRSFAKAYDGRTMVATLSFRTIPEKLKYGHKWSFHIPDSLNEPHRGTEDNGDKLRESTIIIDDDFNGLTVLSSPSDHKADCLAIPGLGGHAFGSFKERGGRHMWLCDDLLDDLPTTRIIIYGYDTSLYGSESFQGLGDLASTLTRSLSSLTECSKTERKPLFFIAHSLGGLIVKEAIIQMSDDSPLKKDNPILNSIYGAVFFGVPNTGMDIRSLVPMVEDQINYGLLQSIRAESELLLKQARQFPQAFPFKDSKIMCFYETAASPTAIKENKKWVMKGENTILVGRASATHGRDWEKTSHYIQPINLPHSRLVKFGAHDVVYGTIRRTLQDFAEQAIAMKRGRNVTAEKLTDDYNKTDNLASNYHAYLDLRRRFSFQAALASEPRSRRLNSYLGHSTRRTGFEQLLLWAAIALIIGFPVVLSLLSATKREMVPQHSDAVKPVINHAYPILAIIGKTGVGKSTFIDVLGGRESSHQPPEICHGLDSCTNNLTFYTASINDEQVYLIDTPGFDDARMSDTEIMGLIFDKLTELYSGDKLIRGLIYLHDISQTRIGGLALKHFHHFETLCGKENFESVALITTKWLNNPTYEESDRELQREAELKTKYWKNMIDYGSRVERHDGSAKSALRIVTLMLNKPKIILNARANKVLERWKLDYIEHVEKEEDHAKKEEDHVKKEEGHVKKEELKRLSFGQKVQLGMMWISWVLWVLLALFLDIVALESFYKDTTTTEMGTVWTVRILGAVLSMGLFAPLWAVARVLRVLFVGFLALLLLVAKVRDTDMLLGWMFKTLGLVLSLGLCYYLRYCV